MRRWIAFMMIVSFLSLAPAARADDSLCPMMTLKHSKELGLSKKQKAEIEKIRDQMMGEMRALKMKASDDVRGVLTAKQLKKAEGMDMGCPMMMKGGECPMGKGLGGPHGGECPMKN